ncbi:MAG: DUF2284 domain-containing protein [Deltaproteobacteria bacterium]|nr:DUF2284 domain-containing protein [Deltaproteobacteria bacterium]
MDDEKAGEKPAATAGFSYLLRLAGQLGATAAVPIASAAVPVVDELADRCRQPRCEGYGLSASCPPYVGGPPAMRRLLDQFPRALVLKIDLPADVLFSSDRDEAFRLLHELVAAVEQAAGQRGHAARGFAGGSCKNLFCRDHAVCRVLVEGGGCRHPQVARPSMSGFGVEVTGLLQAASLVLARAAADAGDGLASLCGLVLLA